MFLPAAELSGLRELFFGVVRPFHLFRHRPHVRARVRARDPRGDPRDLREDPRDSRDAAVAISPYLNANSDFHP